MHKMKKIAQIVLGLGLMFAGFSHLGTNRVEFRAQVPTLFKDYADFVVLASGVVEILLGLGLIIGWKYRAQIGWAVDKNSRRLGHLARRSCRNYWLVARDFSNRSWSATRVGANCCRRVDRRRLLVHIIDIFG